jgi:hypothetical protein
MNKVSKICQLGLHFVVIFTDIIYILMLDDPEFGVDKVIIGFITCVMATIATISAPAVRDWYNKGAKDIDPVVETTENEEERNQQKSDEISDETIMKVLNAIGYEEKSWIPFVREHLKRTESETQAQK